MFVIVNGHELRVPDLQTLRELLSLLSPTAPFAVTMKNLCRRRTTANAAFTRATE